LVIFKNSIKMKPLVLQNVTDSIIINLKRFDNGIETRKQINFNDPVLLKSQSSPCHIYYVSDFRWDRIRLDYILFKIRNVSIK
jgi:hypothetical protein